jgi:TRAP-type C4-dicarboxylate transport system permease small subunit
MDRNAGAARERLRRIDRWLNQVAAVVVALLTGFVILAVFLQAYMRTVHATGLYWSQPATRLAFIWLVFVGASVAYFEKKDVAFTALREWLTGRPGVALEVVVRLSVLVLCALVVYYGISLTINGTRQEVAGLPITRAWFYAVLPVTGVLIVLHEVTNLVLLRGSRREEQRCSPS